MISVRVVNGRSLTPLMRDCWRQLQQSNPALQSPYFCIEFTEAVAHACPDVEVAVVERGGRPAAFLPYHRGPRGVAQPLGRFLSDYQGFICEPGFACDPLVVLKSCSLVAWDFDHLITSQMFLTPFHSCQEGSPILNLADGFEAYAARAHAARAELIKLRRLERDVGPVRLVVHSESTADLDKVLRWKAAQYIISGKSNLFDVRWVQAVVGQIHKTRSHNFSGVLSLLYAGDKVVAGHFGMRAGATWHYWFPAYDPAYLRYSPGLILLLKMAGVAPELGVNVIDLGKGKMLYKERLQNGRVMVAEGSVVRPSLLKISRQINRRTRDAARDFVLRTLLGSRARRVLSYLRGLRPALERSGK